MPKIFDLYNEVGQEGGITVDAVKNFLNENKGQDIQFNISTLGGDLSTAITIHNLIKAHNGNTVANIVGLTASAGTVIAIACDEVKISDNALFLVHNGWREVTGNVYDLQRAASDLMKYDAMMIKIYNEKTGLPEEQIRSIMKASDWMSPEEAKSLGFVDTIEVSTHKIAASAILKEAQNSTINQQLITKLKEKMKIFGKEKKEVQKLNVLALKDGTNLLINAEAAGTGVEIAPLGAASLEDGEYELADGRKISVAGGVITEVKEMKEPEMAQASTDEIVAAVSGIIAAEVAKVKAEFTTQLEDLKKISSTHKPAKATVVTAQVERPVSVVGKIQEITDGIRAKIEESRKA